MDAEDKKMLQETFALATESNKILKKMRSAQKWASFMRYVYWAIIIGLGVGSFYLIQPYIDKAQGLINQSQTSLKNLQNISGKLGL
ncbi:MAG: hypothetical protein V4439_01165 [Patescibacteria group bacterium]